MAQYVLIVGSVSDGLYVIGPFSQAEDATMYAEQNYRDEPWEVAPLHKPE